MKLMKEFRASKYNPIYRDKDWIYLRDDWTSMGDINCVCEGEKLLLSEYIRVENSYISFVETLFDYFKIKELKVTGLEEENLSINDDNRLIYSESLVNFLKSLKENQVLNIKEALLMCRLMLRNDTWCKLLSEKSDFNLSVGHEYYLDFSANASIEEMKELNKDPNLFIDEDREYKRL